MSSLYARADDHACADATARSPTKTQTTTVQGLKTNTLFNKSVTSVHFVLQSVSQFFSSTAKKHYFPHCLDELKPGVIHFFLHPVLQHVVSAMVSLVEVVIADYILFRITKF